MTILLTAISGIFLVVFGVLLIVYKRLSITPFIEEDMPSTDHTITEVPVATPEPQKQPSKPVSVPNDNASPLITFCTAIRDNEGKPGDLNYRNNNPGNCRCSKVGYAAMYGNVKCVNNFSVFPTYDLGWQYLLNLVRFRIIKNKDWTFIDFFNNYAPTSDNNDPHAYASFVAKRCGQPVDKKISDYFNGV